MLHIYTQLHPKHSHAHAHMDWNEKTCTNAAVANSMECLAYAVENGCALCEVCERAACHNNLEMLNYAHMDIHFHVRILGKLKNLLLLMHMSLSQSQPFS